MEKFGDDRPDTIVADSCGNSLKPIGRPLGSRKAFRLPGEQPGLIDRATSIVLAFGTRSPVAGAYPPAGIRSLEESGPTYETYETIKSFDQNGRDLKVSAFLLIMKNHNFSSSTCPTRPCITRHALCRPAYTVSSRKPPVGSQQRASQMSSYIFFSFQ